MKWFRDLLRGYKDIDYLSACRKMETRRPPGKIIFLTGPEMRAYLDFKRNAPLKIRVVM